MAAKNQRINIKIWKLVEVPFLGQTYIYAGPKKVPQNLVRQLLYVHKRSNYVNGSALTALTDFHFFYLND